VILGAVDGGRGCGSHQGCRVGQWCNNSWLGGNAGNQSEDNGGNELEHVDFVWLFVA